MPDGSVINEGMVTTRFQAATNRVRYEDYLMPYGKYRGEFIADIYKKDPQYVFWLMDHSHGELFKAVECIIAKEAGEWQKNTRQIEKSKKCI